MARITKSEKYAVLWLNEHGWTTDSIVKELKLTLSQVNSVIKTHNQNTKTSNNTIQTSSTPVSTQTNPKNFMITESHGGLHKVSVMTKAASEIGDEARKKNMQHTNLKSLPHIYRPNGS